MSVSDPLIKELKLTFQELMKLEQITDECPELKPFCESLERIFYCGLVIRRNVVPSPWVWLNAAEYEMNRGVISRVFSYVRSIEETRDCKKVSTDIGKFRLLLRCCMFHKCLHIPVEVMVRQIGNRKYGWYLESGSVLGHEVLGEILLSVLLQASKLSFMIDTNNARFLDFSWELPATLTTTFVPCKTLGLMVCFHLDIAVVVGVEKGGVAAEDNKIEPGDILDELNNKVVTSDLSGKLKGILDKCRNQPVTVRVVRTRLKSQVDAFLPAVQLYRKSTTLSHLCRTTNSRDQRETKQELIYLGCCKVGRRGDVSLIESGVRQVVTEKQEPRSVTIECRELDILVKSAGKVLMHHPYIMVSSCSHSINYPKHFGYLVGDAPCNSATEYTCHVFVATSQSICEMVLWGLGSGFERTQCTA